VKKEATKNASLADELATIPGGENLNLCIQCGTCSGSCPNIDYMDYSPRQIIAMVRAGFRDEVLSSNTMWVCASCYLCTVRCPRDVKITELMHVLESIALHHGLSNRKTSTPTMYKTFVDSIMKSGRVHELGFMINFYLKSNLFKAFKNAPLGIKLLSHGRLSLKPERIKGLDQLKTILKETQTSGDIH